MTELEVLTVSSVEFDEAPSLYSSLVKPGHMVQVVERSGAATVVMSGVDFDGLNTTIELLTEAGDQ